MTDICFVVALIQRSESKGSKYGYVFCKGYHDDAWWDPSVIGNCTTNLEEIPWNETSKIHISKKEPNCQEYLFHALY